MTHIYNIQMLRNLAVASVLGVLAACSGGAPTTENPVPNSGRANGTQSAYPANAPSAANGDVTAFRINLWEKFHAEAGCARCHASGPQRNFATLSDINAAYANVLGTAPGMVADRDRLVNFDDVPRSVLVTRVAGGHNCWRQSSAECAADMESWIRLWRAAQGSTQILLEAPTPLDPVASRNWPATASAGNPSFTTTVYPLLRDYCSGCHSPVAATRQQPYIGSSDADQSYEAARPRMNLDAPELSRLVQRLRDESHNCWSIGGAVNCTASANAMQAQIAAFANGISATPIPTEWQTSKALTMQGGTLATGGSRYDANVIAKYEFKETGGVARDTSNVAPAMDLTLFDAPGQPGSVTWAGGWGLTFTGGRAQAQTGPSSKLQQSIGLTGEYSIEMWAAPANVVQDNARRLISYAGNAMNRNFSVGQSLYNYNALGSAGAALSTPDAARSAQASLQHVVVTFSSSTGRRIYVNGVFTGAVDSVGASLGQWSDNYALSLGNEVGGGANTGWSGTLRMVAIHNRVLTLDQIKQNFDVGVGEKYLVLFGIEHLTGINDSYVMFEVTRYDGYSYLFNNPKFISLDATALPNDLVIRGMRIGLNGQEPVVGQAYSKLNVTVANTAYTALAGASLSTVGTIIPLEQGPAFDQFFLTFEQIGSQLNVRTEPAPATPAAPVTVPRPSDIGVRTFDSINETFSQITGVSKNAASVRNTYLNVKQALPPAENLQGFLAAHQIAVAQLAISYCSAMVDNDSLRNAFFNSIQTTTISDQGQRDAIINPIVDKVMGLNLTSQPNPASLRNELNLLISNSGDATRAQGLCVGAGRVCDNQARTRAAMKATCAAGLGSGGVLIQ